MVRLAVLLSILMFPPMAFAQTMPGHAGGGAMMTMPSQPGQAAFAAIQEIVDILQADPKTDWGKVNIEALRQHLIDMDNVTLHAEVRDEPVEGGMRFTISGGGAVRGSIQRMLAAHAATMSGPKGWEFVATITETGATLVVKPSRTEMGKLHALGFIGVLTLGMHHQMHHLMIAQGGNPHH